MKLSEIKTKLFTRVSTPTFGFRFEIFDKNGYDHPQDKWPEFLLTINVKNDGDIIMVTKRSNNNKISNEQLNEIVRVANILKEESKCQQ